MLLELLKDYAKLKEEHRTHSHLLSLKEDRQTWENFHNRADIIARQIADFLTSDPDYPR